MSNTNLLYLKKKLIYDFILLFIIISQFIYFGQ